MTTQIKAGVIAANAVNSSELASGALSGQNFTGDVTFSGTTQGTRLGLGAAPHATAGLNITTTNQHMRLNNGSELGIIHVLSGGELELWGHGDGESINFRTGSGTGTVAMNVVGTNVGIGTDSPDFSLDIEAASSGVQLQIGRTVTNVGSTWMGADSNGFHLGVGTYGAGNSVTDPNGFTVDTSGNLLVGTTSTGTAAGGSGTSGININANGGVELARSANPVLFVNRTTDDGDIVQLRKDGSTVGTIGVVSGDRMYFATADGLGLQFDKDNNRIVPCDAAGAYNSNVELGDSSLEFTNLWLSNNAYIGNALGIGTTSPQYKFDVSSTDDITMRIHRPSSGLAATDTCGIGFSQRGDTATSSSDTRAGIFSTYNGDLFLAVEAGGNLNSNPMDHSALFIEGSNGNVGIGTTSPSSTLTVGGTIESLNDDAYGSNEGGQIMLRSPSNTTTSKRYSFDTFNVSNASVLRLISEDDSDGANGIVRMALDTKGTFLFTNGTSSFAHNTYAHAAVFSRNSTPLGTVVIEDSDVSSGIGNTVLNCYLRDQDPASFATFVRFTDGGGTVGSITHNDDGGGVTYNTTSDYRLKENIDYDWDALTLLNQLKPAKFNFIRQPSKTLQGFLAHEVKDIVPSSVQGDKDHMEPTGTVTDSDGNVVYENVYEHFCKTDEGQTWTRTGEEPVYQELDYSRLVPLLTKAIQEQQTIIDDLKSRIETLEG